VGVRFTRLSRVLSVSKSPLFRNSYFLLARTFVAYSLGFFFWLVVARSYSEKTVGIAAALLSTLLLLARGSALGLPTGLLRFLPAESDKLRLLNWTFTVSGLAALAIGLVFFAGMSFWAPSLLFVRADPVLAVMILVSLVFFTLDGVLDNAFTAMRRADYGLIRSSIFHGLRIPFVLLVTALGVFGIVFSWTLSLAVSVVGLAVLLPRLFPGWRPYPALRGMTKHGIWGFSVWSFAGALAGGAAPFLMPLLILNTLGPDVGPVASGHYYAAFTIATYLYAVPGAFSTSLLVEGSHPGTQFRSDIRRTVRYSAPLMAVGIAGSILLGRWVLALFGRGYSDDGYGTLVLLALMSPIPLVTSVLATDLRVAKRVRPLFYISSISSTCELLAAWILLPIIGILGAAVGVVGGDIVTLVLVIGALALRPPPGTATDLAESAPTAKR